MVDCVKEIIANKSCKCGEYESIDDLLFLLIFSSPFGYLRGRQIDGEDT